MNRKSFWIGFILAVVIIVWLFQQRARRSLQGLQGLESFAPSPDVVKRVQNPLAPEKAEPDQLQEITGIGPVFARRLQNAGVTTFAQLASLSPERIREIVKVSSARADVDAWIEQARTLASQ